jgi:hypothetical protein
MRATLVSVKDTANVTLSLPQGLLRKFRIYAATRNQSMTAIMTESIRLMVDEEDRAEKAKSRFLKRIRNAPDRGTKGVISWSRGELHER